MMKRTPTKTPAQTESATTDRSALTEPSPDSQLPEDQRQPPEERQPVAQGGDSAAEAQPQAAADAIHAPAIPGNRTLAIDIGGTGVKLLVLDARSS